MKKFLIFIVLFMSVSLFSQTSSINYSVPEWSKNVIWYQIFPERFCNSDQSNGPFFHDIFGSWPHDTTSAWGLSNWTGDWYALERWENDGQGFYHHVQRRRYGGDLQGIIDKLDYLQELGINAIYLNPVFEAPSMHKYDASSYHHIDDNFGPDPEYDRKLIATEIPHDPSTWKMTSADSLFFVLIDQVHKRDMRIIIDGVWNHVGMTFWAFRDVVKNQESSLYKDWFIIKAFDNPATPESEFDYKGWWDVRELPELMEDENGFNPEFWQYVKNSVSKWMDPNGDGDPSDGIDGWRLDVAAEVGFPVWKRFRDHVRTINPEAYLSGEIWFDEGIDKWLQGDIYDAVMNYRFAQSCVRFFMDTEKPFSFSPSEFDYALLEMRNTYPHDAQYVLQNLMDSHDTDRMTSMIINNNRNYGSDHRLENNPNYDVRKPNSLERDIQKLIVLMQMTYIGAPMVYYGDEAGMWGASDPDERKPMLWKELKYDDEATHPLGKSRPVDKNVFDPELFAYYQNLIKTRLQYDALRSGEYETLVKDDDKNIFIFSRKDSNDEFIIVMNNSFDSQTVKINVAGKSAQDIITGKTQTISNNELSVSLHPKQGMLLHIH